MHSNIWKLNCIAGSIGSVIFISVVVPFWHGNGLTLHQIFLLQSAFGFALVTSQIPTGYLSDIWGRKNVIVTGMFLLLLSMIVQAVSWTFVGFFFAEVLRGFGLSFLSGTWEALLYESMHAAKQRRTYRDLIGYQLFLRYGFEALSSILGGLLAMHSLRMPVYASIVPFVFGFFISLFLQEVPREARVKQTHTKAIGQVLLYTFVLHGEIRSIMLLHSIVSSSTLLLFWFTQPYQTFVGLPLGLFGITYAVIVGFGAFASRSVHALEHRVSDKTLLLIICGLVAMSYLFLGVIHSLWGLCFFLTARIAYGLISPLTNDVLNRMTPSSMRATTMSFRSSITSLFFAVMSPIAGYLADAFTLNQAILFSGLGISALLFMQLIAMRSYWKHIPQPQRVQQHPEYGIIP